MESPVFFRYTTHVFSFSSPFPLTNVLVKIFSPLQLCNPRQTPAAQAEHSAGELGDRQGERPDDDIRQSSTLESLHAFIVS
jgi:hypothetical protein